MSEPFQPNLDFVAADEAGEAGEAFVVDLDGFEGPLHVLLALARTQKVDLLKLSITRLAEQYLTFVQEARRRNFSLAADYLVMASWLAYLKSRLLLPRPERTDRAEPPAEMMAAALAFRLRKLEAMRRAADALMQRPRLKRDVFTRGDPEARVIIPSDRVDASLYDLMGAYVGQRRREAQRHYAPGQRIEAFALEEARQWLRERLPELADWTPLDDVAPDEDFAGDGPSRASRVASTFSAGLELVKEGAMDVRQTRHFDTLYLRRRAFGPPLELKP
ncbi:MAG: segregation and condensation protein A [Brevundimonas sp.]|jgi:segregation and condensation protein A|uniref:segregation and condensation protein A n=1 Tax=Brevundimonas sp. TaxID=1871086 RepID=UPI00391ABF0E